MPPIRVGGTGSERAPRDRATGRNRRPLLKSATTERSGLELPIDHFRLLGVSPTTDAHTVLRTLQLRLDRAPDQGFTHETLQARDALLRHSADLLCDQERRSAYESELTALTESGQPLQAALDVPSSQEVAGLLLLLEADLPLEVFELVSRALQPPQAPALGSGREADLALLGALASRQGAEDLRRQRHFESAANLLMQGQQLLQRMGQHPQQRQAISDDLVALRPFRILDLISRDLSAAEARAEGLQLLEDLVRDRGGLESYGDSRLSHEDFEAFFRQIRSYLTVQEQIDLFSRWAERDGSTASRADDLATTALTASGFAQRKPERIAAARDRLLASGRRDMTERLACLHLLLGQVDAAEETFYSGNAAPPVADAEADGLAHLCRHCSTWLAREVLPGYRDLESDPDLEAYFADRDVQGYLDQLDSEPPAPPPAPPSVFSLASSALFSLSGLGEPGGRQRRGADDEPESEAPGFANRPFDRPEGDSPHFEPADAQDMDWTEDDSAPGWQLPDWLPAGLAERLETIPRGTLLAAGAAAAAVLTIAGISLVRPRTAPTPLPVQPPAALQPPAAPGPAPTRRTALPLTSPSPDSDQVRALLEAWLAAKAAVLAGGSSAAPLEQLARDSQVQRLESERREDAAAGQSQRIQARVTDLRIETSGPGRISAIATIDYNEQRLDAAGQPVGRPKRISGLRNRYVFGRDGDSWRLVSFQRAN